MFETGDNVCWLDNGEKRSGKVHGVIKVTACGLTKGTVVVRDNENNLYLLQPNEVEATYTIAKKGRIIGMDNE